MFIDVTKVTKNVTELCDAVLSNISREETGLIEWKSTTSWSKWDPDICFNSAKCVLCQSSKVENHFPSTSEIIKYCSSPKGWIQTLFQQILKSLNFKISSIPSDSQSKIS